MQCWLKFLAAFIRLRHCFEIFVIDNAFLYLQFGRHTARSSRYIAAQLLVLHHTQYNSLLSTSHWLGSGHRNHMFHHMARQAKSKVP